MNPFFWLLFPFLCVLIVPLIVGVTRIVRWARTRREWSDMVRTQRTAWEQEEIELLREGIEEE